jgi:hypothetical protein
MVLRVHAHSIVASTTPLCDSLRPSQTPSQIAEIRLSLRTKSRAILVVETLTCAGHGVIAKLTRLREGQS